MKIWIVVRAWKKGWEAIFDVFTGKGGKELTIEEALEFVAQRVAEYGEMDIIAARSFVENDLILEEFEVTEVS